MSASNRRVKEPNTIHHLTSRIAHGVYLLSDEECDDLLSYIKRVAEFCGLPLLGWCLMSNHFHLLVRLVPAEPLDEAEIVRRYGVLKGVSQREVFAMRLAALRLQGESGMRQAGEELARLTRRMYSVGEFMKTVKQWFSEAYNSRTSHMGTMWQSVYHDKVVSDAREGVRKVLAYQHLNPVRAGITTSFDSYRWSSFTAFRNGEELAVRGMRFAYGDGMSDAAITANHVKLMEEVLEAEKMKRAMEIARLRAAGIDAPSDPLTDEALIVQAAARQKEIAAAYLGMKESCGKGERGRGKTPGGEDCVVRAIAELGRATVRQIEAKIGMNYRTVYRRIKELEGKGRLRQVSQAEGWEVVA